MNVQSDYVNESMLKEASNAHAKEHRALIQEAMADRNAEYQNLNPSQSSQSSFSFENSHTYANVEPALCLTGGQEAAIDTKHNEADGVEDKDTYSKLEVQCDIQTERHNVYAELKKDHGGNEDKQVSQEKTEEDNHYYDIEEHTYEDAEEAACKNIILDL